MTKILALDTSTIACSAALLIDEENTEQFVIAPAEHGQRILPMIEGLLTQAGLTLKELDAIAFGCGPGSFTGLRIAASVVQGLAFAYDLPVLAISTLAAMAQGVLRKQLALPVLVALDARMQEIYWGAYHANEDLLMQPLIPDQVVAPALVSCPVENGAIDGRKTSWIGVGDGWSAYGEILKQRLAGVAIDLIFADEYPHAHDIALLAKAAWQQGLARPATEALPVYLRDKVTHS